MSINSACVCDFKNVKVFVDKGCDHIKEYFNTWKYIIMYSHLITNLL